MKIVERDHQHGGDELKDRPRRPASETRGASGPEGGSIPQAGRRPRECGRSARRPRRERRTSSGRFGPSAASASSSESAAFELASDSSGGARETPGARCGPASRTCGPACSPAPWPCRMARHQVASPSNDCVPSMRSPLRQDNRMTPVDGIRSALPGRDRSVQSQATTSRRHEVGRICGTIRPGPDRRFLPGIDSGGRGRLPCE